MGLRIHEVIKIDRRSLEKALETGYLEVKGKGGRVREVPVESQIKPLFEQLISSTGKDSKVFVDDDRKAHNVHREIQNIIRDNREDISDSEATETPPLTFHGLRHSYANQKYEEAIERGLKVLEAELEVSKLLGHNRAEVTRIYIT